MTYRSAERPQHEADALRELGALRSRLRAQVLFACLMVGALLGILGYIVVTELQLLLLGQAFLLISAALGFFGPFFLSASFGLKIARRMTQARTGAWIKQCAAKYGVSPEVLEDTIALVREVEAEAEL